MGAGKEAHRHLVGPVDGDCLDQFHGAYLWDDILVEAWQDGQRKEQAEKGGGNPQWEERRSAMTESTHLGLHGDLEHGIGTLMTLMTV